MIDKKWIGHKLMPSVLAVERTRLQRFAKAIGETGPVYTDPVRARAAGYPDLLAPPTFLFCAELDSGEAFKLVDDLGAAAERLLHGAQTFTYHAPVCAGDTVTVCSIVTDIYEKKEGALEFVIKDSRVVNQHDELVAEMRTVMIFRN
jgi:acyl dehydratase